MWQGPDGRGARRAIAGFTAAFALLVSGSAGLQDAVANGDTRTLHLYHEHTQESGSITYRHNGRYLTEGLRQLNWMLRDWRIGEQVEMDPKLFDIVWQVYREARATGPIRVASAYRSPQTNAALRRRSRGVAEFSQHMRGKAMDFFLDGVSMAQVREIGVRLQQGGVGFYPHSRHQFVHLDAGGVRSWPRLPDAQLARLFPDGRTVHIPRSGQPLAGYDEARAAILARGGTVAGFSTYAEAGGRPRSWWAALFGGGADEEEDLAGTPPATRLASADGNDADAGTRGFLSLFGGSRAPAQPPPAETTPNDTPVAEAVATPVAAVAALAAAIPLPPRRPAGLDGPRLASVAPIGPPSIPARPPEERRGEARASPRPAVTGIGADDRAALKSLFATAATPRGGARQVSAELPRSFSRMAPDAPPFGAFGPGAVRTSTRR